MKPFTTIAGLLFLIGAAIHAYRLYSGFDIVIDGHTIPLWGSWIGIGVGALFGIMLLNEARK